MIVTRVRFEDFERFWSTFAGPGAAKRADHGSRGAQVLRNADDPQEALVIFDWDREGFEAFMNDPEVPEIMQSAGLQGPPSPTFVEPQEQLAS
jgi:hypothetical protein